MVSPESQDQRFAPALTETGAWLGPVWLALTVELALTVGLRRHGSRELSVLLGRNERREVSIREQGPRRDSLPRPLRLLH